MDPLFKENQLHSFPLCMCLRAHSWKSIPQYCLAPLDDWVCVGLLHYSPRQAVLQTTSVDTASNAMAVYQMHPSGSEVLHYIGNRVPFGTYPMPPVSVALHESDDCFISSQRKIYIFPLITGLSRLPHVILHLHGIDLLHESEISCVLDTVVLE